MIGFAFTISYTSSIILILGVLILFSLAVYSLLKDRNLTDTQKLLWILFIFLTPVGIFFVIFERIKWLLARKKQDVQ